MGRALTSDPRSSCGEEGWQQSMVWNLVWLCRMSLGLEWQERVDSERDSGDRPDSISLRLVVSAET